MLRMMQMLIWTLVFFATFAIAKSADDTCQPQLSKSTQSKDTKSKPPCNPTGSTADY